MASRVEKYRKQVSYTEGIRKARALGLLARELLGSDHVEAISTARKAVSLARKLHERAQNAQKQRKSYDLTLANALEALGKCLIAEFKYDEAQALIEESLPLLESHSAWQEMVRGFMHLVNIHTYREDFSAALASNTTALEVCRQLELRDTAVEILASEATIRVKRGELDAARTAIRLAMESLHLVKVELQPSLLAKFAGTHNEIGDGAASLDSIARAVKIARQLNDKHLLLRLLFNQSAYMYTYQEDRTKFETPIREAIALTRITGNKAHEALLHEMYAVRTIHLGIYDRALNELSLARDLYREMERKQEMPRVLAWLGLVYFELGAVEPGRQHLREACQLVQQMPPGEGWTAVYRTILEYTPEYLDLAATTRMIQEFIATAESDEFGVQIVPKILLSYIYELQSLDDAAERSYHETREKLCKMQRPSLDAAVKLGLGRIARRQARLEEANILLLEALDAAEQCREWLITRKITIELAEVALQLGQHADALKFRKMLHAREREIMLPQVNRDLDRQMAVETEELLQHTLEQKRLHLTALKEQSQTLEKSLDLRRLRDEEDHRQQGEIYHRIELQVLQASAPDFGDLLTLRQAIDRVLLDEDAPLGSAILTDDSAAIEDIRKRFPQLSPTECKVCIAILTGQSNRRIAESMNVSVRAVETYRYRIRKKLALPRERDLNDFLLTSK